MTHVPFQHEMTVTPTWASARLLDVARAEERLGRCLNRPLKQDWVRRYATDMKAGRWVLTHQSIAFDHEGLLFDGQHRLHAVIRADVAVPMWVAENMNRRSQANCDENYPRTSAHAIGVGEDGKQVPQAMMSMMRVMYLGVEKSYQRFTHAQDRVLFDAYEDALRFTYGAIPKGKHHGLNRPAVTGAVARAYYTANHARIKEFIEELVHGGGGRGSVVMRLRDKLQDLPGRKNTVTATGLTTRVLRAFLDGEHLEKLYMPKEDLFPIPEVDL